MSVYAKILKLLLIIAVALGLMGYCNNQNKDSAKMPGLFVLLNNSNVNNLYEENDIIVGSVRLTYTGSENQFSGGFSPTNAPYGGFGGGNCTASKTPVIFIHGNGDKAIRWDYPASTGDYSPYDYFKLNGYNDCELFGITWLSPSEQEMYNVADNYYKPSKRDMIKQFIDDVLAYTGKSKVDIIAHSMGVGLALETLRYYNYWGKVRKFINISGNLRGLQSCYWMGYANPYAATCGSENIYDSNIFGNYGHYWLYGGTYSWNPRMGDGYSKSFRDLPSGKNTIFYTISAGSYDEIYCTSTWNSSCGLTGKFDSYSNVYAQLNIGIAPDPDSVDYNFDTWYYALTMGGDQGNGVGHYRAMRDSGRIQYKMLNSTCTGTSCCGTYNRVCVNY